MDPWGGDERGRGGHGGNSGGRAGGVRGGGGGRGGGAPRFMPYTPKFLRELGGGAAPEGSIAGRQKSASLKYQPIDQDGDDDDAPVKDWDAMAAKVAEDGGSIVLPDELKKKLLKKSGNQGAVGPSAENGQGAAPTAGAQAKDKPAEEEPVEYDEHGKPVIKFVKLVGTRKKKEDGKQGVKNKGLLSFDEEEEG